MREAPGKRPTSGQPGVALILAFAMSLLLTYSIITDAFAIKQHRADLQASAPPPINATITQVNEPRQSNTTTPIPKEHPQRQQRQQEEEVVEGLQATSEASNASRCNIEHKAELAGDLVFPGPKNKQETAEDCCKSCKNHVQEQGKRPCNIWVWCPRWEEGGCDGQPAKSCWLKWQPRADAAFGNRNDEIKWISGSIHSRAKGQRDGEGGTKKAFHVAVTSNARKYVQWQMRIMYHWYKIQHQQQGPNGQMAGRNLPPDLAIDVLVNCESLQGGFTRILHDNPDDLMEEIPTCQVQRLANEHGFVVMSRPQAIKQWLQKPECDFPEEYVLMAEPDHLIVRPLLNPMQGERPASFPFFYIAPHRFAHIVRRTLGQDLTDSQVEGIDPIGNSPTFIARRDLERVAPTWVNLTSLVKQDKEADREWGWVQEMYAYSMASFLNNVSHDLRIDLMVQPPWDRNIGGAYILHYTYGCDYTLEGVFTPGKIGAWRFDKRTFGNNPPPRNLSLPPDGAPETVFAIIRMVNNATASLPDWPEWSSKHS